MINNFTVIESVYGRFIVNRHCSYQAEHLIKTGRPHIDRELSNILGIVNALPENAVALDIGANIGLVSIPIAQALRSRGGSVIAVEPQRMLYYALCGAAALNDLDNLRAYNAALGAKSGKIRVPCPDYGTAQDFGTISLTEAILGSDGEEVDILAIDDLALPRLDFVKIDVEGMEADVLTGAGKTIERFLPWCWVEYLKTGIARISGLFERKDYKFFIMDDLNMLCAPRLALERSGLNIQAREA